jgi:capsular polysaccharide biosynthesis protein
MRPSFSSRTICIPEVKQMYFWHAAKHLQTETYSLPDIYTTNLNKVIYCSKLNIILTNSREIISDSVSTTVTRDHGLILEEIWLRKTEKISGICTVFNSFANGYYHQLIDNIPRLYLLNHSAYKDEEIKLLCSRRLTNAEKFFLPKILPSNVNITSVSQDRNYFIENLIFPTFMTRRFSGYLPSEYLSYFMEKVAPQRPRRKINRIFISRKSAKKGRGILNEDELFSMLSKYDFKKYILEDMSIEEQLDLFYDSEYVVGSHGAGLSNMIFAERIKVLELFPTKFVWPHFYFLSKAMGHTYQYWCSEEKTKNSNFRVKISEIERILMT